MNCMNPLTGQWLLTGLPPHWEPQSFDLNSVDGKVTGVAAIIVNGELKGFNLTGNYDENSLTIYFTEIPTTANSTLLIFVFIGECAGDNLFDGFLQGEGELHGQPQSTIEHKPSADLSAHTQNDPNTDAPDL